MFRVIKAVYLLLLLLPFLFSPSKASAQTIKWTDAQTNRIISGWRTRQVVRISISNGAPTANYVLKIGTGAASDRGVIVTSLRGNAVYSFTPDYAPYRWLSYVWLSLFSVDSRGKETCLSTLWRLGD